MAVLTVIFAMYFVCLIVLLIGWSKAMNAKREVPHGREPMISVIIPVRNEEATIGTLLNSLSFQEYRNFEIVIVNDGSEDETLRTVSQCQLKNIHVVQNPGRGKKAAITAGVRAARGSLVVTTDADCVVPQQWLIQMRAAFRDDKVMMAFGGVRMAENNSYFHSMQSMEFASLIGTGAATSALGMPTLCNGANLAFRKKVFSQVKGYEGNLDVASGDDEFLMRKVLNRYPEGVQFVPSADAVVTTAPQPGPGEFVKQRIRWASKWRYNSSPVAQVIAVAVVLFQLVFIINWFYVFSPRILQSLFLMVIKMILEAALLLQVCRFLATRWNWLAFFGLQILYPLYVTGVAITSFFRPFEWKHRVFRPKLNRFR
jgi:cellulose synthase/poly-beta-1,6-N-acetylglucosamine synthase-like glycosyltransferase